VVLAISEVAGNSCVLSVASVKTITALLHYMPHMRTPGNLRNGVPFFVERIRGFADFISVVLMEIVLLHLKY
jgi:hypothetical protein